MSTGFSRSVEAGDNGSYSLVGLPPGTLGTVTATFDLVLDW